MFALVELSFGRWVSWFAPLEKVDGVGVRQWCAVPTRSFLKKSKTKNAVSDSFYVSPPPKKQRYFNEHFMAGLGTRNDAMTKWLSQRFIERWRRAGKGHRISRDTAVSWFPHRRFRSKISWSGYHRRAIPGIVFACASFLFQGWACPVGGRGGGNDGHRTANETHTHKKTPRSK